jgi:hypothetical protein
MAGLSKWNFKWYQHYARYAKYQNWQQHSWRRYWLMVGRFN